MIEYSKQLTVAFDVDGTLINGDDTPRHGVIDLARWFISNNGCKNDIVIWSGGGVEYAARWAEKLGLLRFKNVRVVEKGSIPVDIAIDDEEATPEGLNAKVVIRV